MLVLVVWGAVALNRHENAIYQKQQKDISDQQQRFDDIRLVQQQFETNVRRSLGSSLTDMKEYDSCYHLAQSEFHIGGPNGILYCGMEIHGATNAVASTTSSGYAAWNTALAIAGAAKAALQQSGSAFTLNNQIEPSKHEPGPNGFVGYSDYYTLYLNGEKVGCDLTVETIKDTGDINGLKVKSGQLFFRLNCYQQASKNFFQFVPSPLD